jgi:acetyl-CoA synthetase
MLRSQGNALPTSYCYPRLRHIASVGELLDAESVVWGAEIFDIPFHDTWCQAETGAIMIANFRSSLVRPGSLGRPVPGIEASIVRARRPVARGEPSVEVVDEPGQLGELAFRAGWPSMFRGYVGDEAGYRRRFAGGWYLTGEAATRDEAGWFWSLGRADEIMRPARLREGLREPGRRRARRAAAGVSAGVDTGLAQASQQLAQS